MNGVLPLVTTLCVCVPQPTFPGNRYAYQLRDAERGWADPDWYYGPWVIENAEERTSFLRECKPCLSPPYSPGAARQVGGWAYSDGNAHHAVDYIATDQAPTFEVLAPADGRVLYAGWDDWSGNTVVIEHADGVRTIMMHLRNGAAADHERTLKTNEAHWRAHADNWNHYLSTFDGDARALFWGTDEQTLRVKAGDTVAAGQQIGWAGSTGPGGIGIAGGGGASPNTHLHLFVARKHGDKWVFVDPDGLYGTVDRLVEPIAYPSMWKSPTLEWDLGIAVPNQDYQVHFDKTARLGYALADITSGPPNGALTALWYRAGIGLIARHNMDVDGFRREDESCRKLGFRAAAVAFGGGPGPARTVAAVWWKERGQSAMESNVPVADLPQQVEERTRAGYYVQGLTLSRDGDDALLATCIYLDDPDVPCEVTVGTPVESFEATSRERTQSGWRPARLIAYLEGNERRLCAVWWKDRAPATLTAAALSPEGLRKWADDARQAGYTVTAANASPDDESLLCAVAVRR